MTTLIIPISPRRPPNYSSSPSFSSSSPASLLTLCRLLLLRFVLIGSLTLVSSQENSSSKACTAYQPSSSNINNKNIMRAWHCHGRTQKELVDRLRQANIVTSAPTQQVMELVDRQFYIQQFPYQDSPQPIEKSQTISAPHMHAHVLEEILPVLYKQHELHPQDDVKILDVGCGSGYLTACFGRWFQAPPTPSSPTTSTTTSQPILPFSGRVYGMDIHADLVELSTRNIRKADGDLMLNDKESPIISLKVGNGWQGWLEQAPFDAIHVGAAAASFPVALAQQLRLHGVLIVPVGPTSGVQTLLRVERIHESDTDTTTTSSSSSSSKPFRPEDFSMTELLGVRYVPLVQGPPES